MVNREPHTFTRRNFFKATAATVATATLSSCLPEPPPPEKQAQPPKPDTPPSKNTGPIQTVAAVITPTPTSEIKAALPEIEVIESRGYQLLIEPSTNLPYAYKDPNGKTHNLDIRQMVRTQTEAVATNEPQVAASLFDPCPTPSHTPDSPPLTELPGDVLSAEELRRHGITISYLPPDSNTVPRLYLRQKALSPDSPIGKYFTPKDAISGRSLTIIVGDFPIISGDYLNPYLQYLSPELVAFIKQSYPLTDPNLFIQQQKQLCQARLDEAQSNYKKQPTRENEQNLTHEKITIKLLQTVEPEKITELANTGFVARGPQTYAAIIRDPSRQKNVIILPTGQGLNHQKLVSIGFSPDKNPFLQITGTDGTPGVSPKVHLPNPDNLIIDNTQPDYTIVTDTIGTVLRHETHHLDHIKTEREVDQAVVRDLVTAHQKHLQGDDSDYYFVFSLPEGGYILTESEKKTSNI